MSHPEPEYREWKEVAPAPTITMAGWVGFTAQLVDRLMEDAGEAPARWTAIFDRVSELPPADRSRLVARLNYLADAGSLQHESREELWDSAREFVAKHRQYEDAKWALPEPELAEIDRIVAALEPARPLDAGSWLFRDWMPHLADVSLRDDHAAYDAEVRRRRTAAVAAVEEDDGLPGCMTLAEKALPELSHWVGVGIADSVEDKYFAELLSWIGDEDPLKANVAWGWMASRFETQGWSWVDPAIGVQGVTSEQQARLLLSTRDYPAAWERAEALGDDTRQAFWKLFVPFGLGPEFPYLGHVVEALLEVDRPVAAIKFLSLYARRSESSSVQLVLRVLRALLGLQDKDVEHTALEQHDLRTMFEYLNAAAAGDERDEVAQLEWAYLPALGFEPELGAIQEALIKDPSFFSQLIEAVYRQESTAEGDDDAADERSAESPTPDRLRLADNAYRLLGAFERLPGQRADGTMDSAALDAWIDDVLRLAADLDRLGSAEEHVGSILINGLADPDKNWPSQPDPDGTWPRKPVRDLIERLQRPRVESGFLLSVLNSRGVTSRSLDAGGAQERALAERYRQGAEAVADGWPRTAAILRSVATSFESDARREERSAERFRRGLDL
jgi:hypothetical protein